jgi:hypothetical protein
MTSNRPPRCLRQPYRQLAMAKKGVVQLRMPLQRPLLIRLPDRRRAASHDDPLACGWWMNMGALRRTRQSRPRGKI